MARAVALGLAVLAVTLTAGCGAAATQTVVIERATPHAAPAKSRAGVATAGTLDCSMNATDGTEIANVTVTGTASCAEWITALSGDGQYWWPVPVPSPSSLAGALCELQQAGMTMWVSDFTSNAPSQSTAGVAMGVCTSEEQNGWTPSTAGIPSVMPT